MKNGTRVTLEKDDATYWDKWTKSLKLKRKNDDGHEDITYIEFDWYPPQELAGNDFYWGISANIYKYSSGESTYTKWWKMSERLNVSDPQTPELFQPYLYAMPEDSMKVTVLGDGHWSPMPCLFDQRVSVSEALVDYYQKATPGDVIKAHNRFATFSTDKRWVGNLTALQPGEGYLFRRMAPCSAEIAFHNQSNSAAVQQRMRSVSDNGLSGGAGLYSNPHAATNMTMIARVERVEVTGYGLRVFVDDELAAVATPIDSLFFLTIQSDRVGNLRFETEDGIVLTPKRGAIRYAADSHAETMKEPVLLQVEDKTRPYKLIENDHIIIIKNNEKYDVTGKKL